MGFGEIQATKPERDWRTYVLPFAAFLVMTSLEPSSSQGAQANWLGLTTADYPWFYAVKLAVVLGVMKWARPGYMAFPFHVSPLALLVGLVGAGWWIGLCALNLEGRLLPLVGLGSVVDAGERVGFDPWTQMADPTYRALFLATRFAGLVLVVPVIEEFFLRGFLQRMVVSEDWADVPLGQFDKGLVAATVVAMLMHPAELVAAAAWFSLVGWLWVRTKNIWDCVAAHMATNLLLGLYIVWAGDWRLW